MVYRLKNKCRKKVEDFMRTIMIKNQTEAKNGELLFQTRMRGLLDYDAG
jgi:hypothetical protein